MITGGLHALGLASLIDGWAIHVASNWCTVHHVMFVFELQWLLALGTKGFPVAIIVVGPPMFVAFEMLQCSVMVGTATVEKGSIDTLNSTLLG
jgi:hypothetical protein